MWGRCVVNGSVPIPSDLSNRSIDDLLAALKPHVYKDDPVYWIEKSLGEYLWSVQRTICKSLVQHRRTAVYSCHRIGKSFLAARLAVWWIDTHEPGTALVVTSSHSAMQVKAAIWREIGRVHAKGKLADDGSGKRVPFAGRMNQAEWYMTMPAGNEELVAFGRKPADEDTTAFQGVYSRYVLVLVDEACYIAKPLWEGIDTLISNEDSRVIAWANPDDPNTEFGEVCKPGSGWNVVSVGYEDTPNFTGEDVPDDVRHMLIGPTWVDEKRRKWGEDNPMYISKVLGKFPEEKVGDNQLVSMQAVRDAQQRTLTATTSDPSELGVDVGGGGNKNVIAHRHGPVVRIVKRDHNPDTMQTLGNVLAVLESTGATCAKVDYIGIGHGAVDRAKEMSSDQSIQRNTPMLAYRAGLIQGVEVGKPASDKEQYVNLRAEGYWSLRERFSDGTIDIDPDDDDLAAQLVAIRYKRSGGRIQIESKEEMRRDKTRRMSSPDEADAVMLAYLDPPKPEVKKVVRTSVSRIGRRY